MRLRDLEIHNFKAIDRISAVLDHDVSLIVGPNAIGKTTILEAVRLNKALLAPRTHQETNQTLISMNVLSPHLPNMWNFPAIIQDLSQTLNIRCRYDVDEDEVALIAQNGLQIAASLAAASMGQPFAGPSVTAQLFSSSQGQEALDRTKTAVDAQINALTQSRSLRLYLNIDPRSGIASGEFPIEQSFLQLLDNAQPPELTKFSYYPADRALPAGEQPFQLGTPNTLAQLESHNSQPRTKYHRLKNAVFGAIIANADGREKVSEELKQIFDGLLPGKSLGSVGTNAIGLLRISIHDDISNRDFDLDGMSSGEKGLLLTFFLLAQSTAPGALILLDEPELHLNPSVCRTLLPFLVREYIAPKNAQAIICSHSPEVLSSALELPNCALYHMVDSKSLREFRTSDQGEATAALSRLGTSHVESLLYKGTVFVEGDFDVDVLQLGFTDSLLRYNVKALGGRKAIERDVRALQEAERTGAPIGRNIFILDFDRKPTALKGSPRVKVQQWGRYCLENYLIDEEVLWDVISTKGLAKIPFTSRTELRKELKNIALSQLDASVVHDVFETKIRSTRPHITAATFELPPEDAAKEIAKQYNQYVGDLGVLDQEWVLSFKRECSKRRAIQAGIWEAKWSELCSGKRLFADLYRARQFQVSKEQLLRMVVEEMRIRQRPNWLQVKEILEDLLA